MYCSNCGSEVETGSQYCNTCGQLVAANLVELKQVNIASLVRILTPICFILMFLYNGAVWVYTFENTTPAFNGFSDYTAVSLLFGALYLILGIIAAFIYNAIAGSVKGIFVELKQG